MLTGNDVWVRAITADGEIFKAELDSGPAEGLIVADDCGDL